MGCWCALMRLVARSQITDYARLIALTSRATPLGFEPRITPPKGAVLPLHHGVCGLAILDWRFSIQAQCPKLERDRVYAKQLAAKIDVESVAAAASMMAWPQPPGPSVMERTIYLQHYRVCLTSDGVPREINKDGAAITYGAVDERSREPVDLKLIRLESIDPGAREKLEEQARAAQSLRQVNIAKAFDFG